MYATKRIIVLTWTNVLFTKKMGWHISYIQRLKTPGFHCFSFSFAHYSHFLANHQAQLTRLFSFMTCTHNTGSAGSLGTLEKKMYNFSYICSNGQISRSSLYLLYEHHTVYESLLPMNRSAIWIRQKCYKKCVLASNIQKADTVCTWISVMILSIVAMSGRVLGSLCKQFWIVSIRGWSKPTFSRYGFCLVDSEVCATAPSWIFGIGNSPLSVWSIRTPNEKLSVEIVYCGGSTRASGGM